MPRYFDEEDKNGVRITIDPKGIWRGHKKLKKIFSPSISVGKKAKLIIKFEKLKKFNEQDAQFWHGKAILKKMPKGKPVIIEIIKFLKNEQVFEKEIESEFTSCEGDMEYKVGSRLIIPPQFYAKDAFPLYTANVRSTEWNKRDLMLVIFGGVISGVLLLIIAYCYGIY